VPKDPNEGLLGNVFGKGGGADNGLRYSEQPILITADESQTGQVVPDQNPSKQCLLRNAVVF